MIKTVTKEELDEIRKENPSFPYINGLELADLPEIMELLQKSRFRDNYEGITVLDLKIEEENNIRNALVVNHLMSDDKEKAYSDLNIFKRLDYVLREKFSIKVKDCSNLLSLKLTTEEKRIVYLLLKVGITVEEKTTLLMENAEVGIRKEWRDLLPSCITFLNPNLEIVTFSHT